MCKYSHSRDSQHQENMKNTEQEQKRPHQQGQRHKRRQQGDGPAKRQRFTKTQTDNQNNNQSASTHNAQSAAVRSTRTVAEILQNSMREANNNNHIANRGVTGKKGQGQQRPSQHHQGQSWATPPPAPASPSRNNRTSPRPTSPPKSPSSFCAYAGAKFSDPPSPKVLPKPPIHWVSSDSNIEMQGHHFLEMSCVLKNMLKVSA